MRGLLGHESKGQIFRDRFLIADVRMTADFPGRTLVLVRSALPSRPVRAAAPPARRCLAHRLPAWLGRRSGGRAGAGAGDPARARAARPGCPFELEWVSVYTFSCLRMAHFRDGRVLFAGDAAHGVSPFGARGANSGVQDADNLAWKLRAGAAGPGARRRCSTATAQEREFAADENILHSTRSTDFITPKSEVSRDLPRCRAGPCARTVRSPGRWSTAAGSRCRPRYAALAAEHARRGRFRRPR